jgi:hypothetical protein
MPEIKRPQKITFAEMRASGVRGLLLYCSDYHCSHWTTISGDQWPDDVRLSDLEPRFICQACGRRGADVRPHFGWELEARTRYALLQPATPLRRKKPFFVQGPRHAMAGGDGSH